jgi:hypothetical protein
MPLAVATVVTSLSLGAGVRPPSWLIADVLAELAPDPTEKQVADAFMRLIIREINRAGGKPRDPFLKAMLRQVVGPGGRWHLSGRRR